MLGTSLQSTYLWCTAEEVLHGFTSLKRHEGHIKGAENADTDFQFIVHRFQETHKNHADSLVIALSPSHCAPDIPHRKLALQCYRFSKINETGCYSDAQDRHMAGGSLQHVNRLGCNMYMYIYIVYLIIYIHPQIYVYRYTYTYIYIYT